MPYLEQGCRYLKSVILIHVVKVGKNPKMSGPVFRLVALPEVRVHGQVVADRVLPLVVVGREVRIAVSVNKKVDFQ